MNERTMGDPPATGKPPRQLAFSRLGRAGDDMFKSAAKQIAGGFVSEQGRAGVGIVFDDALWSASVGRDGMLLGSDERYLLYSFTKTIVAAAALRLVADGVLELDAPPPTLQADARDLPPATLRQILQHTGGLPDYGGLAAYHEGVRGGGAPWSDAEFLARTNASRCLFEPGRGWAYSNIGYMLLRRALSQIGGDSFAGVLCRQVFDPLAIDGASVPDTKEALSSFTFGLSPYLGGAGSPIQVQGRYDPRWIATGVVGATPLDAARLLHGLLTGDLLPPQLLQAMTSSMPVGKPVSGRPWQRPGYGLGVMIEGSTASPRALGHTGAGPGCSPAVYHFPGKAKPLTICVVTNGEDIGQAETMAVSAAGCFP